MKAVIPVMKGLMKRKENAQQLEAHLQTFTQLFDSAVQLHESVIPLLPEDEQTVQSEWFSSIKTYSGTFKDDVMKWLDKYGTSSIPVGSDLLATKDAEPHLQTQEALAVEPMGSVLPNGGLLDDVNPSDSISNVPSNRSAKSSVNEKKSVVSTTSSARIKAEADLAALMARQQLLQEKHALDEQEELIRKRKEKLNMEEEIAAHMAKLSVLRAASTSSAKGNVTQGSSATRFSLHETQGKQTNFNADAAPFIPQRLAALGTLSSGHKLQDSRCSSLV